MFKFETLYETGLRCCPFFLFLDELRKLHSPVLPPTPFPTGAGFGQGLPDHSAVRAGRVLAAAGPGFPRAATAALDSSPLRPRVGSVTRARPRLPVHRRRSERLGPGERRCRCSRTGRGRGGAGRTPGPRTRSQDTNSERHNSVNLQLPTLSLPPSPPPQVSFFIFVIFTTYAMLPLGMRDAAAAGLTSSLSHLLVLGLYLGPQPDSRPALLPQVSTHMAQALPGTGSPGRCLVVWAFTNWLLNRDPMAGRHSWAQGANTGRSPLCPPGVGTPVQHHACRHHERGLDLQGRKFDGGPGCWGQIWTMEPSPKKKKKMQNLELGWFCAAGGSGSGVIFQAEETYVQGFLELRGDAGAGAKSGAGGMGERSAS